LFRDYNRAFLRSIGAQAQAEGAKASKNLLILNLLIFFSLSAERVRIEALRVKIETINARNF